MQRTASEGLLDAMASAPADFDYETLVDQLDREGVDQREQLAPTIDLQAFTDPFRQHGLSPTSVERAHAGNQRLLA